MSVHIQQDHSAVDQLVEYAISVSVILIVAAIVWAVLHSSTWFAQKARRARIDCPQPSHGFFNGLHRSPVYSLRDCGVSTVLAMSGVGVRSSKFEVSGARFGVKIERAGSYLVNFNATVWTVWCFIEYPPSDWNESG